MTFVNHPKRTSGDLTLGPLECYGNEKMERIVSFSSPNSYLEFDPLKPNEDFKFLFRTFNKQPTVLLYQAPGDSQVTDGSFTGLLTLTLDNGNVSIDVYL